MHIEDLQHLTNRYLSTLKTMYWSRMPGDFVHKLTGKSFGKEYDEDGNQTGGPRFTGTVREWYETLVETVIGMRSSLNISGMANVSVSPDVATILECTVLFKPMFLYDNKGNILLDDTGQALSHDTIIGALNGMRILLNPDQPRNKLLVFNVAQDKVGVVEVKQMDVI